ncbi:MAG: phosphoketolase [Atopobiaceae bacterium]|nr:phosphoketolase [Atopobiaceae bacterium]
MPLRTIGTPWHKINNPVSEEEVAWLDRYWRIANYLSVGQIYLRSNPLMRDGASAADGVSFSREDVKHRLVGHWGTTPGINFLFGHVNRLINDHDQSTVFLMGPGHGGPAGTAQSLLDGTYREVRPQITDDEAGLARFFRQFSYPGGVPSHYAPETPGSIHEGGELGYTLSHAYGAVLDNPSLLAVAVVGDGEAETGPLATSWQTNKFMDPLTDGVVLPILHLNGYKIANPTILARISDGERDEFFRGMGYHPHNFIAGFDDEDAYSIHRRFAALLEQVFDEICDIKTRASYGEPARPSWPMIIFRTPKGWTCPKYIDGKKTEGSWRSHQVPLSSARDTQEHFEVLRGWLESYHPERLFDERGAILPEVLACMPKGELRLGANPNANGGLQRQELVLPDVREYEVPVATKGHGWGATEATRVLGDYTADLINDNRDRFRIFGPDETASNRLQPSYQVTDKQWFAGYNTDDENDEHMSPVGNIIEQLSEHQCEGLLEGYLLTGRHGLWSSYESFVHIVDSMVNQHCKWLEATVRHIPWRAPISSTNMLLSSHVWRQDHNGFSHQDPGFVDVLLNKNFNNDHIVNVYYPADANMLLAVGEHCYQTTNCVNAIFAGKQPAPTFLSLDEAYDELARGVSAWTWAGNCEADEEPDIVIASCGDVPTLEALAAADMLEGLGIKVRFVNVVELLKIQNVCENDQAISDEEFEALFTTDRPVLFAFHAYPGTIRRLIWDRPNHDGFHVHGYQEQGSTTTPFDMLRLNDMDRWALAAHALRLVDRARGTAEHAAQADEWDAFRDEAFQFAVDKGYDHPAFADWVWREVSDKASVTSAAKMTGGDNEDE